VLDKGVTVRDLCEVTGISPSSPGDDPGYVVQFRDLDTGTHQYVCARRVVLAAGTLNTMHLLFAAARQSGGLAPMPALGRRFFANGDLAAAWLRTSAPVSSFNSTPSQGEFTVDGHESQSFGFGGLPGIETLPLPGFARRWLQKVFFMYAMGADSGAASACFAGGRLCLDYDYREEPVYRDLREALRVVSVESGSRVVPVRKPLSPHVSGGACLGATAADGVVDHRGEVHGNPGLYVADAAALPAAPGGPPSVAIAAWAHHVADGIARTC
jgi:cholesterol oxidase